jgi:Putative Actinobacterial Holin-X, holin superfamily III
MAPGADKIPRASVISLVRGIIDDAKQLLLAQYEFRKYQTLQRVTKAKTVALWIGIGIALAGAGGLLIILMVVHLLYAYLDLPLWASYGIVGIILLAVGGIFLYGGKNLT